MGQAQSDAAITADGLSSSGTAVSDSNVNSASAPSSMESLISEAEAYGNDGSDENEDLDAKARKALECPCIADLRNGPCGKEFSEAFLCFLKSTAEEKGSDCVHPFVELQNCIKAQPDAFSKDVLEDDAVKNEVESKQEPSKEYKIYPPAWSIEQSRKPRL